MNRLNKSLLSWVAISSSDSTLVKSGGEALVRNRHGAITSYNDMTNAAEENAKCTSEASDILLQSQIVCFDVDSTVIQEEGIDELASYCGKGAEVSRLTKEAMGGSMTFQEALRRRLDIIRPSQKQIREFLLSHPSTLSPGIKDLITQLKSRNIDVFLITGGFDFFIEPIAQEVGIPMDHVFANKLLFYFNGNYASFDVNQPTSRSGGKGEAISIIRQRQTSACKITMIGDGATDLEASPPADHFIGYGGNVVREEVRIRSQYYVTDFAQLMQNWN